MINKLVLGTLALSMLQSALAQTPPASPPAGPPPPPARGPALELALEAAKVAIDTCTARDMRIGVSVLDSAGVAKVVLAADGASARGVASSTGKALAALNFKTSSAQVGELAKTDKTVGDALAANTNLLARPGAVLIKVGDDIIGAIGVGGARGSDVDEACAVAGLQKVQSRLK